MLNTRALEGFVVTFAFSDRGRLFVRVHVRCSHLTQSHSSCPHNRGKATTVSFTPEPPFTPMVTNGLLELGDSGTGVMQFEATVQSDYSGVVNWTQLINRYGEYGPLPFWYTTTHGDYWLDTSQFYGDDNGGDKGVGPTVNDPTIHFNDNPGIQSRLLYANITDSFQTYLVFNPGGGIWVTLGIVDWGWFGNALYFTSGWELDDSGVTSPTYTDSDVFPIWPEIYTGTLQNN